MLKSRFNIICFFSFFLSSTCLYAQDVEPTLNTLSGVEERERAALEKAAEDNSRDAAKLLPGEKRLGEAIAGVEEGVIKEGESLSLLQALESADVRGYDMAKMRLQLEKSQAQLKQAWAAVMPQISAEGQWIHAHQAIKAKVMGAEIELNPQDTVKASLSVGLSLVNVSSWYTLRMVDEGVKLSELGIEQARQMLLSGVAKAYFAALMSRVLVEVQKQQVNSAEQQVKMAQSRLDSGIGVRLDLLRAEFNLESAKQSLTTAIWGYEAARDALGVITNVGGLPVPEFAELAVIEDFGEDVLIKEGLENSYELRMNAQSHELKSLEYKASIAKFFPSLTGAWQGSYMVTKPGGFGSSDRGSWNLVVKLNVPIFNYANYGELDVKQAELKSLGIEAEQIRENSAQAIRKARRDYFNSLYKADKARRQVELADEALSLTESAYMNGVNTFLDVSDAQRNLTNARIGFAVSMLETQMNLIELKRVLGRDAMKMVQ